MKTRAPGSRYYRPPTQEERDRLDPRDKWLTSRMFQFGIPHWKLSIDLCTTIPLSALPLTARVDMAKLYRRNKRLLLTTHRDPIL